MNEFNEYHLSEYPFHTYKWERIAAALGRKMIKKLYQRHGRSGRRLNEVLFEHGTEALAICDNGGEVNLCIRPRVLQHPTNPTGEYTSVVDFSVPYTQRCLAINEETLAYRIKTVLAGNAIDYDYRAEGKGDA